MYQFLMNFQTLTCIKGTTIWIHARFCFFLPGSASTGSWGPRYTPSRAHVSIRHQAARPPAGVSNY